MEQKTRRAIQRIVEIKQRHGTRRECIGKVDGWRRARTRGRVSYGRFTGNINKMKKGFCDCVPSWFKTRKFVTGICFWCQEHIKGKQAVQTIAYRCDNEEKRVHWHSLMFHPTKDCVEGFHDYAKEVGWGTYYDAYSENDMFILLQTIAKHKRTGKVCKKCKRHEETHAKFKTQYCSKECETK